MKNSFKYKSKRSYEMIYLVLLCLGLGLILVRWMSVFQPELAFVNDEINSHISNLALSLLFYLFVGYTWLLSGVKFKVIIYFGIFMIIANLCCEMYMTYMNTLDMMDACYGILGVLIGFIYLYCLNRNGVIVVGREDEF